MMKYVIWGYNEKIQKIAENNKGIVAYADNDVNKVGLVYEDKEVYSAQKVKRLYIEKAIDGVIIPNCINENTRLVILLQLFSLGVDNVFIMNEEILEKIDVEPSYDKKRYNIIVWSSNSTYYRTFIQYLKTFHNNVCIKGIGTDRIMSANASWNDIPFVYISKLKDKMETENIDFVVIPDKTEIIEFELVVKELKGCGIEKICKVPYGFSMKIKNKLDDIFIPYEDREELMNLQYMVSFHCNLNCKGCSHFSPLIDKPIMANVDMVRRDIKRFKEIIKNIWRISLLGGEPLLNPELGDILKVIREEYPYSDIEILTNGILVPQISGELAEIIRETRCSVLITQYPGMDNFYLKAIDHLEKEKIFYSINMGKQKQAFSKRFIEKDDTDINTKFEHCVSKRCVTLYDGKISTCYLPITVSYYDKYFGTKYYNEADVLDIYDDLSGKDVVDFLRKTISLCSKCNSNVGIYYWDKTAKQALCSDYSVNGKND